MANWIASLDKPVVVEPPNAVAYITYASDDGRSIPGVRVPYAAEIDLMRFLARECKRLASLDDRNTQMAAVVTSATIVPGLLALPDISKDEAIQAADFALKAKLGAAIFQKQIDDAAIIDPTVADAKAALDAAIDAKAQP